MLDVLTIRLYLLSKPVTPDSPGRSGRPTGRPLWSATGFLC